MPGRGNWTVGGPINCPAIGLKSLWKIDQDQGILKFFDMLPLATFQLKRRFSKNSGNNQFFGYMPDLT
jgi:hypothetical protein